MDEKENKKTSPAKKLLSVTAIILIIVGAVFLGYYIYNQYTAQKSDEKMSDIASTSQSNVQKALNPIDFKSLKEKNNEIYAWIKIDGTKVDYPIVQSNEDDNFYLKHSAIDKSWLSSGAIYTQSHNTKDFDDPITVIYGHNGYGDKMFTTLHRFEKNEFFTSNKSFVIYTESNKLTYEIVSAFKYDDRHIMNAFDFQDTAQLTEFQDTIKSPVSSVKNVRENLSTSIDLNSKIVVLSTCITGQKSSRYLVCGVLIKNEQTN